MRQFDFRQAVPRETRTIMEEADKMPIWPRKGSIAVIKGFIVIKLNEYNNFQRAGLCGKNRDINTVCRVLYNWPGIGVKLISREEANGELKDLQPLYQLDPIKNNFSLDSIKKLPDTGDGLTLEALTPDPKIILPKVSISKKETALLNITINTPEPSEMRLLWRWTENPVHAYKYGQRFEIYLKEGTNRISILIPGKNLQYPLRIDPINYSGEFTINELEIYKFHPNPVK